MINFDFKSFKYNKKKLKNKHCQFFQLHENFKKKNKEAIFRISF